jgi:branched-chain amino acid transport system ATP-binding protein
MLRLESLSCGYGEMRAVQELDLEVPEGSITALLGANGAGKSSTILCIAGLVEVQGGRVRFYDEDVTRLSPVQRVKKGIALSPEGRRLFADLSVRENLVVGGYVRPKERTAAAMEWVVGFFPRLGERMNQAAGSLSGGEQQMLAIGRALMAEPKLLLVDELSLGLMPKAIDVCYEAIAELNAAGLTVVVVEQSTERALEVAHRVCVLESGRSVWQGSAEEAREDATLLDKYLAIRCDLPEAPAGSP